MSAVVRPIAIGCWITSLSVSRSIEKRGSRRSTAAPRGGAGAAAGGATARAAPRETRATSACTSTGSMPVSAEISRANELVATAVSRLLVTSLAASRTADTRPSARSRSNCRTTLPSTNR